LIDLALLVNHQGFNEPFLEFLPSHQRKFVSWLG